MKNRKQRKKSQIIIDIVIVVIIIALLSAAGVLIYRQMFPNNTPILKYQITKNKRIDWELLRSKNPDTVGWLSIDGTNIDTPVVQSSNNDTYLYTNFEGQSDERGVPFLDCEFLWEPISRNSVIYGHSTMRSGVSVLFDDLLNYTKDPNYIKEHGTLEYKRPPEHGGNGKYAIFAVLVQESDYDYRQIDFSSEEEFMAYYSRIKTASIVARDDVTIEPGDEIVTLSTCIFNTGLTDGRLAIIAKRITEPSGK